MTQRLRQLINRLGGNSGLVLTAVLCVVGGVWLFAKVADEVAEGETQHFDDWAIHALRQPDPDPQPTGPRETPLGPRWLQEVGRDMTGLGGVAVLALLTAAVCGYLLLIGRGRAVWLVLAATLGALLWSSLLKHYFARPRPDVSHFSYVYTSSFPSGHSMLAASVYLTLGGMLARFAHRRAVKFYCLAVAITLTLLVGVSRVYMGVHFPTDVIGGWTAGTVWALICWLVVRYLQHRRTPGVPEPAGFEPVVENDLGPDRVRRSEEQP